VVEVREMIRRHNMTPVQWAAANGLLKSDTVLAHCILLDDHPQIRWHTSKDLDLIAEAGARWRIARSPSRATASPWIMSAATARAASMSARHRLRAAQSDRGDAAGDRRRPADERGHQQPRHGRRLRGRDLRRRTRSAATTSARWRPAWRPTSCWSISTIR
jgi:hypothetical protein